MALLRSANGVATSASDSAAHTRFGQRQQAALAVLIGLPQAQLTEGRIGLVDPAIAVGVERGEFGKAVAAHRAEQLPAIVDAAVVVAVEGQKAPAANRQRQLVLRAVCVEVKGKARIRQARAAAGKVKHQRVFQAAGCATFDVERKALTETALHLESHVEADLPPIGRAHHAGCGEPDALVLHALTAHAQ